MNFGLRVRLIGTLIGAILVFFAISAVAANMTMSRDLAQLGAHDLTNGSTGFSGYWNIRSDQVRLLTTQVAIQDAIRRAVVARDSRSLSEALSNIAHQSGLAFLTIVDINGRVIGRANDGPLNVKLTPPAIERALQGETVNTSAVLPLSELRDEQLAPQIVADIKSADGTKTTKLDAGLALIAAAPISDVDERTVGAVYAGIVLNHYYDLVDQSTTALGGKAAIVLDGAIISSSMSSPDGTRLIDQMLGTDVATLGDAFKNGKPWTGRDTEGGVTYLAEIDPVTDDQNRVVAARWYGIPLAEFTTIQNHTIESLIVWGVISLVIALALAIPVVESLCRALIRRAKQVRVSTRELSVIVVGGEISGDHVAMTREAVERQGDLLMQAATASQASGGGVAVSTGVSQQIVAASALNAEILGDVVVIDTLAQEMSDRMKQAVSRVNELNDVANGLNELVTGTKN